MPAPAKMLAHASWMTFVIAFIVKAIFASTGNVSANRLATVVLFTSGVVAALGALALRRGARGVLLPALIGLCFNGAPSVVVIASALLGKRSSPRPAGSVLTGSRFDYRLTVPTGEWREATPEMLSLADADREFTNETTKVNVTIQTGAKARDLSNPEAIAKEYAASASSAGYAVSACARITVSNRPDLTALRAVQGNANGQNVIFMAIATPSGQLWVLTITAPVDQEAAAAATFETMASTVQFGPPE